MRLRALWIGLLYLTVVVVSHDAARADGVFLRMKKLEVQPSAMRGPDKLREGKVSPLKSEAQKNIRIVMQNLAYMPFFDVRNPAAPKGFIPALLDAFAKEKGYAVTYVSLPVIRGAANFYEGDYDLKFPDNSLWFRRYKKDKKVHYSGVISRVLYGVFILPENRHYKVSDLSTISTILGFAPRPYQPLVRSGKVRVMKASSVPVMIRQLLQKRSQAGYANIDALAYYTETQALKGQLIFGDRLPQQYQNYHFSTTQNPALIAEIDAWCQKNKALVAQLMKRYGIKNLPE